MPSWLVPLMMKPKPCGSAVDCAMMSSVMVIVPSGIEAAPLTSGQTVEGVLTQ